MAGPPYGKGKPVMGLQLLDHGKGGKPNHSRKFTNNRYNGSPTFQTFRSQVLRMRNAHDPASVSAAAAGLKEAVLQAARVDAALDDSLLGMAASQCARHKQADLLGLLCAQAVFRLSSYSGRSVAELASAAVKLDSLEAGFAKVVTTFCTSPPTDAFTSIRDIAMVASALRVFVNVDHAAALCGLADAALPLLNDTISERDLAELLHQLAQLLFTKCDTVLPNSSPKRQRVIEVLSQSLTHFQRRLHCASAMDVAMVAGVIAGLWPLMEGDLLRETMLRPCLSDLTQLVRFRRTEFNAQDLANIAMAFAKVGVADADIADVLDEQTNGQLATFSNKDIALLLCAAARLSDWSNAPFAKNVAWHLLHRDLTRFSPQDLCTSAQSLAKLGSLGVGSLQRIADEAFQRQLRSFTCNDKAILLWALAKIRSKHSPLLRILVRALAFENVTSIDRELASATIWALARIWQQLPTDEWPQTLFHALCALTPWAGATNGELCCTVWAVGKLLEHATLTVWDSLSPAISSVIPNQCSLHELCLLLCGLSACRDGQVDQDTVDSFIAEMVQRLQNGQELPSDYDKQLLNEAFDSGSWTTPPEISEMIAPTVVERPRIAHLDEFSDSELELDTLEAQPYADGNSLPMLTFDCNPSSTLQNQHGSAASSTNNSCPTLFDERFGGEVRLNMNCDFEGHCIQLKNTFIHIQCNHNEQCSVCKFIRSRSCDVMARTRFDSDDNVQDLPFRSKRNSM
jgi:hypothetical protein